MDSIQAKRTSTIYLIIEQSPPALSYTQPPPPPRAPGPAGRVPPTTAAVGMTNSADLAAVVDHDGGGRIVLAAIDNLTKGAGGQAIQAMNALMGWPETTGLLARRLTTTV